jgi:hypothetical protein
MQRGEIIMPPVFKHCTAGQASKQASNKREKSKERDVPLKVHPSHIV